MKNTPEIRFKGFTDDWVQRKLGEVAKIVTGSTPSTKERGLYNGDYLFVSPVDIQENRYIIKTKTTLSEEGFNKCRKIRQGASFFVCIGSTIGKIAQATIESVTNQQINSVIGNNYIDDDFTYTLLEKESEEIPKLSATQAVPIINKTTFENIILTLPEMKAEQSAIGNFFRILDKINGLYKRKTENLKLLKKACLQQMFPNDGETVPKIRFTGFTGDWEEVKLGDVVKVNSGRDYKHLNFGNIPVYGTGGYMLSVDESLSDNDAIGIGRKGTIDKPQLLRTPFWTVDTLFFMIPEKNNDLLFLYALSQGIEWAKLDESTGVPSLSKINIENIVKYFPSFPEQAAIGGFFLNLDMQISAQAQILEQYKKLKMAYLHKMFI